MELPRGPRAQIANNAPKPWATIWCRFLILLVESWRIVVISGTVHWLYMKTIFHPLLWTSSGLTGSWKLSTYIRFGSLRSVKVLKLRVKEAWKVLKVLNLMVIRCLRSLKAQGQPALLQGASGAVGTFGGRRHWERQGQWEQWSGWNQKGYWRIYGVLGKACKRCPSRGEVLLSL